MKNKMIFKRHSHRAGYVVCRAIYFSFFIFQFSLCAAQFVPDSLCTVDTLHWEPNPDMQARHAAVLNDRNAIQLEAAKRFGLHSPLPSREGAEAATAGLTRIESCDAYTVDSLEYSIPFLTTAAEALVKDIGEAFRDSVRAAELGEYRIIVTSVLRTVEDVECLRASGNRNAVPNSTHCFATTFDLSYERFYRLANAEEWMTAVRDPHDVTDIAYADPEKLTNILVGIVTRLRAQGRCYSIFERGENCIHITVRR